MMTVAALVLWANESEDERFWTSIKCWLIYALSVNRLKKRFCVREAGARQGTPSWPTALMAERRDRRRRRNIWQ